jgi:hypothetical protein
MIQIKSYFLFNKKIFFFFFLALRFILTKKIKNKRINFIKLKKKIYFNHLKKKKH